MTAQAVRFRNVEVIDLSGKVLWNSLPDPKGALALPPNVGGGARSARRADRRLGAPVPSGCSLGALCRPLPPGSLEEARGSKGKNLAASIFLADRCLGVSHRRERDVRVSELRTRPGMTL